MAKRRKKSQRKHSSRGKYCITVTRKCTPAMKSCRGGLSFSTSCYKTADKQGDAVRRRFTAEPHAKKGIYSINIYRRK